jgi:hypothetical protein
MNVLYDGCLVSDGAKRERWITYNLPAVGDEARDDVLQDFASEPHHTFGGVVVMIRFVQLNHNLIDER